VVIVFVIDAIRSIVSGVTGSDSPATPGRASSRRRAADVQTDVKVGITRGDSRAASASRNRVTLPSTDALQE